MATKRKRNPAPKKQSISKKVIDPPHDDCEVISRFEATGKPFSVKRKQDGVLFYIQDRVSNGTAMCGFITGFNFLEGKTFVEHTYSGVGMNLDSLVKVPTLPSRFQIGDSVAIKFKELSIPRAAVTKVHFNNNKVLYDLQVWFGGGTGASTRIHNVDSAIVENPE